MRISSRIPKEVPPFLEPLIDDIVETIAGLDGADSQSYAALIVEEFVFELYRKGYAIHEAQSPEKEVK